MKGCAVALAVVVLGAACTSAPPSRGAPVQTDLLMDGMSDDATDEIADDVLTYQEYRDAFERFRECIVESGETLTGVYFDSLSGMVNYSVSTGDDICYDREFYAADASWQLNPDRPRSREELNQMALLRACISDIGVEPVDAKTQHELYRQIMDLGVNPTDCLFPPTTSVSVAND